MRKTPLLFSSYALSFILFLLSYVAFQSVFLISSLAVFIITFIVWTNKLSNLVRIQTSIKDEVEATNARFMFVISALCFGMVLLSLALAFSKVFGMEGGAILRLGDNLSSECLYTLSIIFGLLFIGGLINVNRVYKKLK